jgi:leucyl aminopeptidase
MKINLEQSKPEQTQAAVLATIAFEDDGATFAHPWIQEIRESGEFEAKAGQSSVLPKAPGIQAARLAVAGGGKRDKFTPAELRKLAATVVRGLRSKAAREFAFALDASLATPEFVAAVAEGSLTGDYEPDQLKTDQKKADARVSAVTILVPQSGKELAHACERGRILGEAQNFTRDLVNEPANLLTPTALANYARAAAGEYGLGCEVLDREQMKQIGMGSLLGVAQGSDEPPVLIVLRYQPAKPESKDHLALVGKGVTFDTGGVSIKPSDGMEKMKYDMAGGAAVIGAMRAIAQLKPGVAVTGFIPAVENHVSGRAQRPGDIVKSLNGKTVEVLNTDAEGRLILIDAITYAIRQGCTHLVDAATLTGAIVVALGHYYVGGFSNNDDFFGKLQSAAKAEGERIWQLPLDDDYKEYLKSAFADLPNIGGRAGGSITAAYFLKEFTEDKPWVHLDIAGTAWLDDGKPFMAKGPTGVGVRTFVRLAENWG